LSDVEAGMAVDELKDKLAMTEEQKKESAGRVSRRSFLSGLGAAGVAVGAAPLIGGAAAAVAEMPKEQEETAAMAGAVAVTLKVNGKDHAMKLDPRTTLLDCLRENLDMPGTKKGCDHGQCGACTVHVNGRRVNSEHDGYQCGYCTSGQIMSAVAVLKEGVGPTDEDVKHAMYGNICRCGAYPNIVAAVQSVRRMG
jgi:xanthine dehydrogenase YagT iron-sulfur-binding subunit